MSTGGAAIRGSRVGAGPMGEQDRGFKAERFTMNYYCAAGHSYSPQYALNVDPSDIPEIIDCPNCGLPAGQDKANPPVIAKHEPYKTHLAYVKERRTLKEAKELLDEAVSAVRVRRVRLAEEAKQAAKLAAKASAKKAAAGTPKAGSTKSVSSQVSSTGKSSKAVKTVAKQAPAKKISAASNSSVKGAPVKTVSTKKQKATPAKPSKAAIAKTSKK
jgi:hypothetical protein